MLLNDIVVPNEFKKSKQVGKSANKGWDFDDVQTTIHKS